MVIEFFGFFFNIILGTIGHFLYDWSNNNKIIGFFFATDESIWQHLKLGITPVLLWIIIELLTSNLNNIFFVKFICILIFILTLLFLYYFYKLFTKKNILFLDISIFYISLFVSYYFSIILFNNLSSNFILNLIGFIGIIFILFFYKVFNKY